MKPIHIRTITALVIIGLLSWLALKLNKVLQGAL